MAKRQTPRSMLQQYIDNVPTTAPVKRTRSRTRSPEIVNVTASQRKKKRLSVQQTPRSIIKSYVHERKTQTPFIKTLRRRSVTSKSVLTKVQSESIVTPRTALQEYLEEAPDESPYVRPSTPEENSDSNLSLPNETIAISHSPNTSGEFVTPGNVLSQMNKKENRQRHHITFQQFSQGMNNLTSNITTTKDMDNVFSSSESESSVGMSDIINSIDSDKFKTQRLSSLKNVTSVNQSDIKYANESGSEVRPSYSFRSNRSTSKHLNDMTMEESNKDEIERSSSRNRNSTRLSNSYRRHSRLSDIASEERQIGEEEPENEVQRNYSKDSRTRPDVKDISDNNDGSENVEESGDEEKGTPESGMEVRPSDSFRSNRSASKHLTMEKSRNDAIEKSPFRNRSSAQLSNSYRRSSRLSDSALEEKQVGEKSENVPGNYSNKSRTKMDDIESEDRQITNDNEKSYNENISGNNDTNNRIDSRLFDSFQNRSGSYRNRSKSRSRLSNSAAVEKSVNENEKGDVNQNRSKSRLVAPLLVEKPVSDEEKRSNQSLHDISTGRNETHDKEKSPRKSISNSQRLMSDFVTVDKTHYEDGEDSEDLEEDTENFQLYTPHLHGNISHIPTPIGSSTPAPHKNQKPVVHVQKEQKTINPHPKPSTKTKTKITSSVLPNNVIKQVFQHFSNMRFASTVVKELVQFTDTYFKHTFRSIESFAQHSGRSTVNETDVELMMKRQGFITEKQPLEVLVEKNLPLELRQEIIPMATAYNEIIP